MFGPEEPTALGPEPSSVWVHGPEHWPCLYFMLWSSFLEQQLGREGHAKITVQPREGHPCLPTFGKTLPLPTQFPTWFRGENQAPSVGRNSFGVKTVWSGGFEETPGSWTEQTCRRCWCQACRARSRDGVGTQPRYMGAWVVLTPAQAQDMIFLQGSC